MRNCNCKKQSCGEVIYCKPIVIREEAVCCHEEKTFIHEVLHVQPVVVKEVENHVYKHEYKMEKVVRKEERRREVGKRDHDWCAIAKEQNECK
ncbi:MAG: hypothetical protein ACRCS6_04260 [Turicibacter sp.]